MNIFVFLLMFLGMLVPILLFSWWIKRWTGYDPRASIEDQTPYRRELELLKRRNELPIEQLNLHEKKENPHFDKLVDDEWEAAKHLEQTVSEDTPESDEVYTLSELLEQKNKKS